MTTARPTTGDKEPSLAWPERLDQRVGIISARHDRELDDADREDVDGEREGDAADLEPDADTEGASDPGGLMDQRI